jgi:glutathione synthase/RimK-type ligase-like ATP-grasp enzyme
MKSKKTFKLLVLPAGRNISQVIKKFPFDIELTKGTFKNIEFRFQEQGATILYNGVDLKDFSFVWLSSTWTSRDLAYAVKLYLENSDTSCTYVEKGTSKLTDQMLFALNGIPAPDTFFVGRKDLQENVHQIEEVCGFPLVIKDAKGSGGKDSALVKTKEELFEEIKKLPKHKNYLLQRYISNDSDWGIIVADGKVFSGEKSYRCAGEFRHNASRGAKEIFVDGFDVPEEVKEMALKSSAILGLSWSRADIIIDEKTNVPYLLEVNRFPGLSQKNEFEEAYQFLSSQLACCVK